MNGGNNPFTDLVTMKAGPDGGGSISLEGFTIACDDDDCVRVPAKYVDTLKSHGFTVVNTTPAPVPSKKR